MTGVLLDTNVIAETTLSAATAALRRLTLATRNVRDFDGLGPHIGNPWESPAG